MIVKTHILREIRKPVPVPLRTLGWRDFTSNPDWKHNLISTTSLLWHQKRQRVICGLTSFDTDILYEFDPSTEQFHSLDYTSVAEKFEIKIHRSLVLSQDGSIYGATAGLHREDQRYEAPGGRIFRYDFDRKEYDFLGIPVPHEYIQTITLDEKRSLIYGVTYPVFNFFVFDIKLRTTRYVHYVGSVPHVMAQDDEGGVWSTWGPRTHNLFRYDPEQNTIRFYNHSFPGSERGVGLMYPGAGPIDMMINGRDGFLYVGITTGDLMKIDPDTAEVVYLGRPTAELRMSSLALGPDNRIWGICGFQGVNIQLFAYDRNARSFEVFGKIVDPKTGVSPFIAHDMCFAPGGRIFVGETDTENRAGYLWEISV